MSDLCSQGGGSAGPVGADDTGRATLISNSLADHELTAVRLAHVIQALRTAGTIVLVLVTLGTGMGDISSRPAMIDQAVFAVCALSLGYLIRSAVQEHRDKRIKS